jgi:ATP-dependent Clp protease ATP-binding subunit ClpA
MFDRFTDRARKVMGSSRQESQRFNHDYIGVEHVLLGLIAEGGGVAVDALKNLDVDPKRVRREVEKHITHGTTMVTMGQLPFTKPVKRVLEFALEEASSLGHNYIGTEHLLLGLIREEKGIAAQALHRLGVSLEEVRGEILELLGSEGTGEGSQNRLHMSPPEPSAARPSGFFDRFTDRARKVMGLSRQEALRFNHDYIGTEHILLGLIREGSGVAADVLKNLDLDPKRVQQEVESLVTSGSAPVTTGQLPFTPRAKAVLEFSAEESSGLGHAYIGTEHLLLGLIREEKGVAAQVLTKLNLRLEDVREEVSELLGVSEAEAPGPTTGRAMLTRRARRAMDLARAQAGLFRHEYTGPEHILLGILEGEASSAAELASLMLRGVRAEVEGRMTRGAHEARARPPLAPSAMTVLEAASEAARAHGHAWIGTGHLIVGLIREGGPAAQVLSDWGVRLDDALEDVQTRGVVSELVGKLGGAARETLRERRAAPSPFPRFTDKNRKAMGLALLEARRFQHDCIDTEHVLLGLVANGAAASEVLRKLGVDPERVRAETERRVTPGKTPVTTGQLPFTPAVKRALELTLEEANALDHAWIREEHLLLGLVREGNGTAAQVLADLGVTADALRQVLAKAPGAPPE